MEALSEFFAHPVLAVILLLGILVFVHELGHFLVGKACGIGIEIFSIGFGPQIASFQRRETNYRLSVIPLGGYVKYYGGLPTEEVPESIKGKEFYRAAVWKRVLTVLAGPGANFLLAVVVYAAMGMHGIPRIPPVVGEVMPDSPAEKAGLEFGDVIRSIDAEPVRTWRDLQSMITRKPSQPLVLEVERNGDLRRVRITPATVDNRDLPGQQKRGRIGISPGHLTSVVDVLPEGAAADAGVTTGDRISGLTWAGTRHPVKYWRQIPLLLDKATQAGAGIVQVHFQGDDRGEISLPLPGPFGADTFAGELGVSDAQLTIKKIDDGFQSPLRQGDRILSWDGVSVSDVFAYSSAVNDHQGLVIPIGILRDGKKMTEEVRLKAVDLQKAEGKVVFYTLPVNFMARLEQPEPLIESYGPGGALWYGMKETVRQTGVIAAAVYGLFTGDMPLKALGGPISIAKVASDSVKMGWMTFASALALISVNLGLLNLFPIPVLDGGQLVLLATEGIRRRPLSVLAIENFQKIGFVMVLALIAMATYNDLSRFWTSMLEGVAGFFQ